MKILTVEERCDYMDRWLDGPLKGDHRLCFTDFKMSKDPSSHVDTFLPALILTGFSAKCLRNYDSAKSLIYPSLQVIN